MAGKKKSKSKSKAKPKKAAAKKSKKKVVKKKVVRKAKPKKAAPKKAKAKAKPAKKKAVAKPAAPATVPTGERIGVVTHYYNHLQVAIVRVESGSVRTGDTIHIKGHTSDFQQKVDSMEVDHIHVDQVGVGQSFGVRVKEHAREHDVVYKTPGM